MIFIETPVFTRQITALLDDDEYGQFQRYLMTDPIAGDVIQGTGGLRKVRWSAGDRGKRGGIRVIYYYLDDAFQFRMLLAYQKGIKDDLSPAERKMLKAIRESWR